MRLWWDSLQRRERWLLGGGAAVALALLLYGLAWLPFQNELARLRQAVSAQHADLAWMRQAAAEIRRLKASGSSTSERSSVGNDGRSLLTLVDQTAKTAGLDRTLRRIEPEGDNRVQLRLEQVSFDRLITWLIQLEGGHGIETANAVIDRRANRGLVNARLILQRTSR